MSFLLHLFGNYFCSGLSDRGSLALASAYAGFGIMDITGGVMEVNENTDLGEDDYTKASELQKNMSVKVASLPVEADTGMTATQVMGCGVQKGAGEKYRGIEMDATLLPKIKIEVIVSKIPVTEVIKAAKEALYTGHIGDGKIFVYNVQRVVKVRTGKEGVAALQDVE